ncbi:hypothetical protein ACPV5S_15550 [Vibrio astriarenae]
MDVGKAVAVTALITAIAGPAWKAAFTASSTLEAVERQGKTISTLSTNQESTNEKLRTLKEQVDDLYYDGITAVYINHEFMVARLRDGKTVKIPIERLN